MSASGQPVGGLYVKISSDTSDLDRNMNRARREMERTEQQSESLISSTQALEGAFVAAGAAAVGLSAGLGLMAYRYSAVDQQLAQIQGSTQATTAQMDAMRMKAQQLGEELPISLVEATEALHSLTTAGLSSAEATEALSATANLAAVGELKMAEAATTTVGVLNAFNLEASRASAAADTIAAAAASSTADIQGMADALRESSSAANQLGVSSQEISAFIGTLTAAGVEASTAGSSINDALSSLASPSQEARTALASAGLAIDDFRTKSGDLKDMVDVLALLRDNLSGMSEERQRRILSNVFGDRGGQAIGQAIGRLDEYKQSLEEVSRAQVAGGIDRLGELSDQELSQRQQEIGFDLQPGSTRDVLEQYRQLAQREGLSQDQLSSRVEVGLNISPRAADLLAGDLTGGTDMGNLVAGINNADTAAGRAAEGMDTFRGRVVELGGSLDTFFYKVYQGAKGPMSAMLAVLNPIADWLAQNDEVAYALGVTMVGLAGAATAAAIALGVMYAELVLVEGALLSTMATTTTYSYIMAALSPTQLAAAASSFTLSGALATVSGALSAATGAALSFWAAIGPIGWVILGLIGLFAAWKTGLLDFLGLGSEAEAVVESLMWALGGLADALGVAGVELGGVVDWLLEYLGVALRVSTLGLVVTIKALGVALRYLGGAIDTIIAPFESLWNILTGTADAADWLTVALLAIPGVGLIAWALNAAGALDPIIGKFEILGDTVQWAGETAQWALNQLNNVPIVGSFIPDSMVSKPTRPGTGQNGGGTMTTQNDQATAATGPMSRRQRATSAEGGGDGATVNHSPSYQFDLGLDGLDLGSVSDQVHDAADTAINDLRSEIETQLFRFQNGQ